VIKLNQSFKFHCWVDVVIYICEPDNDFLYLGMIANNMNIYYGQLYNIIKDLETLGLIKTVKVGNIRKINKISKQCFDMAKNLKQTKEVINNGIKKNNRSPTNR